MSVILVMYFHFYFTVPHDESPLTIIVIVAVIALVVIVICVVIWKLGGWNWIKAQYIKI